MQLKNRCLITEESISSESCLMYETCAADIRASNRTVVPRGIHLYEKCEALTVLNMKLWSSEM
jgi:hypothetical protein